MTIIIHLIMSRLITIYKVPRLFEPLEILIDSYVNSYTVRYYLNDQLHRRDGPASIDYLSNNTIVYYVWYLLGECHRDENDTMHIDHVEDTLQCCKNSNSSIWSTRGYKAWYDHDRRSRLNGPSCMRCAPRACGYSKSWCINGIEYKEEDYHRLICSTKKIIRRWRMWRNPKIVNCWRWMNSLDGQSHFFREGGAGRKAHIRELNKLVIVK
jgi:hypothetical protein